MSTEKINTDELYQLLDDATVEILQLMSFPNEESINTIPFDDSWTAAQLLSHVTKSNNAIAQALEMEGEPAERNPGERATELKEMFLDFTIKFQSPEFILPTEDFYSKEILIAHLENSVKILKRIRNKIDLSEMINLPPLGEITKLELLYFVLYHTQRHIHQLKNILMIIENKEYHFYKN